MGAFAIPLAIAAAGFSAYSAYSEASAQKQAAKAQAQIARNNAVTAENNAKYQETLSQRALDNGTLEANKLRQRIAAISGGQRAGFAGSGVLLDTGSPLDIISDTGLLGGQDVQTTLKNANDNSFGYRMGAYNARSQGANFTAQANIYQSQANNISPLMSAAGSALGSAASISSKWDSLTTQPTQGTTSYYTQQGALPWQSPGAVNPFPNG